MDELCIALVILATAEGVLLCVALILWILWCIRRNLDDAELQEETIRLSRNTSQSYGHPGFQSVQ
jgi:hypothetical protein